MLVVDAAWAQRFTNVAETLAPHFRQVRTYPGCALEDIDGDGRTDVYITGLLDRQSRAHNALYLNLGGGAFEERAADLGLAATSTRGVAFGDLDNDGDLDLYVGAGGFNRLHWQEADGAFREGAAEAGVAGVGDAMAVALADVDRDGWLDIFVANHNLGAADPFVEAPDPSLRTDPMAANVLYRNNGDGTFTDIAAQAGVAGDRHTWAALFFDMDDDGDPDLAAAEDLGPIAFYENLGDGTFREITHQAGLGITGFWMGLAAGDVDGDLDTDLLATNSGISTFFVPGRLNPLLRLAADEPTNPFHALYINGGDRTFTDIAPNLRVATDFDPRLPARPDNPAPSDFGGLQLFEFGWGCALFDAENDGDLDLYFAGNLAGVYGIVGTPERGAGPGRLLRNDTDQWTDITFTSGIAAVDPEGFYPDCRSVATGDVNSDGLSDVLVVPSGRYTSSDPFLFVNAPSANRWLTLRLEGTQSNRSAVGARVVVRAGDLVQVREVRAGDSFLSHSTLALELGLGTHDGADQVIVRWPGGRVEDFGPVAANQALHLVEGLGAPTAVVERHENAARPTALTLHPPAPNPFNAATTLHYELPKRGHVHLAIYTPTGQHVRTLVSGARAPGSYAIVWDGTDAEGLPVASAVYLVRLRAGTAAEVERLVLLR